MFTQTISSSPGWASLPPEILIKNIVPYLDQGPTLIARMEQICKNWREALKGGRTQESPIFGQIQLAQNFAMRRYEKMDLSKADTIIWKESLTIDAFHPTKIVIKDKAENIQYSFFYKDGSVCLEIVDDNITPKTTHSIPLNIGSSIFGVKLVEGALLIANGYGVHFFKRFTKNNISNTLQLKKITSLYSFFYCREFKISNDKTKIQFENRVLDFASPNACIHRWDAILSNKLIKGARVISCLFKNLLPVIIINIILCAIFAHIFAYTLEKVHSTVSIIFLIWLFLFPQRIYDEVKKEMKENPSSNLQALLI